MTTYHPHCKSWTFPPERPHVATRTNVRELVARPERFEHHLVVVAQIGGVQLEVTAASEPLFFAHANLSDEFALPFPTGDIMVDSFPFRTFVMDRATGGDVGRYNHKVGELVLHPDGWLHWPGRLRPPYEPMQMLPELRRCGMSVVYCANKRTPSTYVADASHSDIKPYVTPAPPMALVPVMSGSDRIIATIGTTTLALVVAPERIAPPRGGWVLVLEGDDDAFAGDLHRIADGDELDARGISRALVFSSHEEPPDPIPASWQTPPEPLWAPLEAGAVRTSFTHREITVSLDSEHTATIAIGTSRAEVPRYWLARMLFRVALHPMSLNYVETYGGLYLDDSGGDRESITLGLRNGSASSVTLADIESMYRAVAPTGYAERLPVR